MKNKPFVFNLVQEHEGLRLKPYRCTAGKLTIGIGRNLEDKGITHKEAVYLFDNDIKECVTDLCRILPGRYHELTGRQQGGLISMRFQLGPHRFRGFKRMIAAVMEGNMTRAAAEIRDSKYARDGTPERAEEIACLVESH